MGTANSKIVDLKDYLKTHPLRQLPHRKIEALIVKQDEYLNVLDSEVLELLQEKHKLKHLKPYGATCLALESNIVEISKRLTNVMADERNERTKAAYKDLLEQCNKLLSKHGRVKQNISDDIGTCRYEAGKRHINPIELAAFLVGTPVALANITKTFPKWTWLSAHADQIGVATAFILGFRHQIGDAFALTGQALLKTPKHVRALGTNIHHSTLTTTMIAARAIEETRGFESHYPDRLALRPKSFCTARL